MGTEIHAEDAVDSEETGEEEISETVVDNSTTIITTTTTTTTMEIIKVKTISSRRGLIIRNHLNDKIMDRSMVTDATILLLLLSDKHHFKLHQLKEISK